MTESDRARTAQEKSSQSDHGSRRVWVMSAGAILVLLLLCVVLVVFATPRSS